MLFLLLPLFLDDDLEGQLFRAKEYVRKNTILPHLIQLSQKINQTK